MGREMDGVNASVAGSGGALAQLANDARQAEIAYGRLLRKSLEVGQAFGSGAKDFVTGANANARVVNAVASGSGQNGELSHFILAGGVPYSMPFGSGGVPSGPGGLGGWARRAGNLTRWIGGEAPSGSCYVKS